MSSFDEIRNNRIQKVEALKKAGVSVYPVNSARDHSLAEAVSDFDTISGGKKSVHLCGRIMSLRPQGALVFFTLDDGTGRFQGLIKKGEIDEKQYELFATMTDIGDFIEVYGPLFVTARGEKSIQVLAWKMLSKSLRPLPEKWHGLQDADERFRKRYLDTLMSPEVKARFLMRSRIIAELRSHFDKKDYLEVETPMLQPLSGGASAEPFVTHHNALDMDLFLRIAPELYLKKLLIGGFPKVYEINRNFRNEGIDMTHNPEFTMLEFYESFSNASEQMIFTEKMLKGIVKKLLGKTSFEFDGQAIDFKKKFATISYSDLLKRYALVSNPETISLEDARAKAMQLGVKVDPTDPAQKIIDNIYKKTCRPKIIQPTFVIDYPTANFPLAKKKEGNDAIAEVFQFVVCGIELVKGFSELNDPLDQRARFEAQEENKKLGDAEAQTTDEEFIEAMEYGMPPAGGVGIGIDRLVMLLTNTKNIKEVILFPTMRNK
ncbi:lysine--tRNA ligase [Candidatus Parcubacteria bacterium]|nr:lysine--tRNA ligase [Candidatus Parcubacteria bacterium]